jgi:hypothetical protein
VILGRRLAKRGDAFEAEMFGYNWAIDKDSLLTFVQKQKREGKVNSTAHVDHRVRTFF